MSQVREYVLYYHRKLGKCKDDEKVILDTIEKLSKPTLTAEILMEIGIHKVIYGLCKKEGKVGEKALPLFNKWKPLLPTATKDKISPKSPVEGKTHLTPGNNLSSLKSNTVSNSERSTKNLDHNPPTRKDQINPDADSTACDNNAFHRSKSSNAERNYKLQPLQRDFFASEAEASRESKASQRNRYNDAERISKYLTVRKDHFAPEAETIHSNNASHRGKYSNSDRGSKVPPNQKDHFAPDTEAIHDRNACRSSNTSHRDRGSAPERASKHQPFQKDRFAPDAGAIRDSNVSNCKKNIDSESSSKSLTAQKDHFAVEGEVTRPGSAMSDHNGVSSQESNQVDIDSSSNPYLSIEPSDRLNSSDEADHNGSTKSSRILEPYYIEMKEGMFRAVKSKSKTFSVGGFETCEFLKREIMMKTGTYKRERDKFDFNKDNEDLQRPAKRSSKEGLSDGQKPKHKDHLKNGPVESKSGKSISHGNSVAVPSRHDLKRKSSSPCPGSKSDHKGNDRKQDDKRVRHDRTPEHKLKIKKEERSPSHVGFVARPTKDKNGDRTWECVAIPGKKTSKPPNNAEAHQSNCDRNKNPKKIDSPDNSAMHFISSKKDRRAVYSGKKGVQDISTLKSSCLQFLRKNLDCLRCPMQVPYKTLQPILETLNPTQLSRIEEHNNYLLAHTNELWKQHFNRDYRGLASGKNEKELTWKVEYNRAHEEQKKKLKNLTASISAAASKAKPDRQAKLTPVDARHDPHRKRMKTMDIMPVGSRSGSPAVGTKSGSPVNSIKSTSPAVLAKSVVPAAHSKSSTNLAPKASSSGLKSSTPVISRPKEAKLVATHKPVKKVVAPLMSKVKKYMGNVYRQK